MKTFSPSAGFYTPSLLSVFLVVIFIAALFGTRMLNRPPEQASESSEVRYSERYLELLAKESLSASEQAELELETCRFRRDTIDFLKSKAFANLQAELASYEHSCEEILPLE